MNNIYESIPDNIPNEVFLDVLKGQNIRIERILSKGQTSPQTGWYDQDENEWVIVLQGSGTILFEDGKEVTLGPGDYLNIERHQRHKVTWTDPDRTTLWLAVFYT